MAQRQRSMNDHQNEKTDGAGAPVESGSPSEPRPSAEEVAQSLLRQAKEWWAYFRYYLSVRSDQTRLRMHQLAVGMVLAAIGAMACVGLLISAAWFVLVGMAGGFATLFDSPWLGQLTAGVLMLAAIALGLALIVRRQRGDFLRKTRLKNEQQRVEQQAAFGRDVSSGIGS